MTHAEKQHWMAEQLVKLIESRMVSRDHGSQYHTFIYETPEESVKRALETMEMIIEEVGYE